MPKLMEDIESLVVIEEGNSFLRHLDKPRRVDIRRLSIDGSPFGDIVEGMSREIGIETC